MTDAGAILAVARMMVPVRAEPDVKPRLVENPDAEMSGRGHATQRPAVLSGLDSGSAGCVSRVDPAPNPPELAPPDPSFESASGAGRPELSPRSDLDR